MYTDNFYMYAPTAQPLTEGSLQAPVTRKGKLRKHLAETILAAHAQGQIQATIGRAPDFYSPGVHSSVVGEQFFTSLLAGKRVPWLGKLDVPHALSFKEPYLFDGSKYTRAFGSIPTSHDEAMRQTVAWYRKPGAP